MTYIRIQSLMILLIGLLIVCLMGAFAVWDTLLIKRNVIGSLRDEGRLIGQEFAFGVDMRHEADRFVGGEIGKTGPQARALVGEITTIRREMQVLMAIRHNVIRLDLMTRHEGLPRLVSSSGVPLGPEELKAHALVHAGQREWLSLRESNGTRNFLYVVVPFFHQKQRLGTVGVGISLYEANTLVRNELERTLILLFIGFLALAAILSIAVRALVLNPVHQISEAMMQVGEGRLEEGPVLEASREAYDLASSFNQMVGMLSDRTRENQILLTQVKELNSSLTRRIEEATRELVRKNDSLEQAGKEKFYLQRKLSEMERMAAIGEGLAIVAHELGNPLHSISGHIELALEEKGLSPEISKHLLVVQGQIDRMINVIRKLLMLSRRERTHAEPVRVSDLVSDILKLLSPRLEKSRIHVETDFPDPCPRIDSDLEGLQSILINFLENALDATGAGGTIRIRCVEESGSLTLHVQDSGPGIPPEGRDRIFEPFFTTKPHGTGLGLAICRKIIDDLGGDVRLGEGPGGHFVLTIPFVRLSPEKFTRLLEQDS